MMRTVLAPTKPRSFLVGPDKESKNYCEPEEIVATDYVAAFLKWWRVNRGRPADLQVEVSCSPTTMEFWIGYDLYFVTDITEDIA